MLIKKLFNSNIKKQAIYSYLANGLTYFLGFLTLPLVLHFLDKYQYGVFATITSMVSWINQFDFGLGNGLRNRLAESYSQNDYKLSKTYISTAYFFITIIALFIILVFLIASPFISWVEVFNAHKIDRNELNLTVTFIVVFFSLRFATSLINKVFYSLQKASWVYISGLLAKVAYLVFLWVLVTCAKPSLFYFAFGQGFLAFFVPFIIAVIFFGFINKELRPSYKYIDLSKTKMIMGLGIKFFIIQVANLIIYSTNNFLISHFVDPSEVTSYQIPFTLFSTLTMSFTVILDSLWSAYTQAYALGKFDWIKNAIRKSLYLFGLYVLGTIVIVLLSPWIFDIWIRKQMYIPMGLTALIGLMMMVSNFVNIFDTFVNGTGKIKLQMYQIIFSAVINIPVCYLFAVTFNLGTYGIVLGSIISYFPSLVLSPLQSYLIMNQKDKGIFSA